MFKKAKHWLLILLVCVLFVGLIPGKASAAAADWVYNGVSLPPIPAEYPNAVYQVITYTDNPDSPYRLDMSTQPWVIGKAFGNDALATYGANIYVYFTPPTTDVWEYSEVHSRPTDLADYSGIQISTGRYIVWTSHDLYTKEGTLYKSGSAPVKPMLPQQPVFRVNLPRNYVYDYEAGEDSVQLYVDAYSPEGLTVSYTWMVYAGSDWEPAQSGVTGTQYFKPPTDTKGVYRYMCRASVSDGNWTATADSNPVYVLVESSLDIPGDDGTSISPGDQVIIDQMGQIGDDVGSIKDSIDTLPEDIKDSFEDALQDEKEQANMEGGELVDDLTAAIPDISGQMLPAYQRLAQAFSYEGTSATLQLPALVMPGVGGLWEETTLLAAQEIRLDSFVGLFPEALVMVVRVLLSLALGIFCAKELYSVFAYFFMGRSEE